MHKQINKYDYLSRINDCTHWHINPPKTLLCLCVVFYSLFVYTCVCVFLHIQSPLRECRSIRSGVSGLPYYCAPLVCVSAVLELLAVWRHNKPKTKKPKPKKNLWRVCSESKLSLVMITGMNESSHSCTEWRGCMGCIKSQDSFRKRVRMTYKDQISYDSVPPCMNKSRHTHEWVTSHTWTSQVTHMNESRHTHEWVKSHIWMSHVTHMGGWGGGEFGVLNACRVNRILKRKNMTVYNMKEQYWKGTYEFPRLSEAIDNEHLCASWPVSG